MKMLLYLIVFFAFASRVFAQSQLEMNKTAVDEMKLSQIKMDSVLKRIIVSYSADKLFLKNLRSAQKNWEKYVNSQVETMFPKYADNRYGSMKSMCMTTYKKELIDERRIELSRWLTPREEGDCMSSISIERDAGKR